MEVRVPGSEAQAAAVGHRCLVGQLPILEAEHPERSGVLGRLRRGVVAPGAEHGKGARRRDADLMVENPNVQPGLLLHLAADRSVPMQVVDP